MSGYDIVVVGGGHNGLVAATTLARQGRRTLVLERRAVVGGAAISDAIAPGFRTSTLAHYTFMSAELADELELSRHGVEFVSPDPFLFAPAATGPGLLLSRSPETTAASIAQFSSRDAEAYGEFRATMDRLRPFMAELMASPPPEIEATSGGDLWSMLMTARRFRALGKKDAYRLLRWAPMPIADFVTEWFESEPLRAAIAAQGILGTALGPRSAGSTAVLLIRTALGGVPRLVKGGLGALTAGIAASARAAGAEIRTDAAVARIDIRNGRASGVTLESGESIEARAVVSNADPRRTLLGLVDPVHLEPGFLGRIRNYRAAGNVAKINLALSGLPAFTSLNGDARAFAGQIHIGPNLDYLERAFDASKYGGFSKRPQLDITIPSLTDPSLAPPGGHVMSIVAQFAPFRLNESDWASAGPLFADAVVETLSQHAPNIGSLIVQRQVITPAELETTYSLTGGHIFHGELALDQLFTMRPLLGWARYRTPVDGLYLCGAGTHPGYGVSGLSGRNAAREVLKDMSRSGRN